jgi:phosphonopyruvate decarboxylase
VSPGMDFCAIAAASGYPSVAATADPRGLGALVAERKAGLAFVHAPILPGVPEGLPRPTMTPPAVAARLREWLTG